MGSWSLYSWVSKGWPHSLPPLALLPAPSLCLLGSRAFCSPLSSLAAL